MQELTYKKDVIVEHPRLPNLGRGKIMSVKGSVIEVIFANGQTKKFETSRVHLKFSQNQEDFCPKITSISKKGIRIKKTSARKSRLPSFEQSKKSFQETFPSGFSDPLYIKEERDYKMEAHVLFSQNLGEGRLEKHLLENRPEEVIKLALQVINKVNLPAAFEKTAFRDALKNPVTSQPFFHALAGLLNNGPDDRHLSDYFKAVDNLPQTGTTSPNKWTNALVLPFLAQPDRFVFLKPEATKDCAAQLNHSLDYKPALNLLTYRCLESLYRRAFDELIDLGPKDNIDIQSFIWKVWNDRK